MSAYRGSPERSLNEVTSSTTLPSLLPPKRMRLLKAPPRPTRLNRRDTRLFQLGLHGDLSEKLGAHPMTVRGTAGTYFAVWAPNAQHVSIIGDFNGWDAAANRMRPCSLSGVWEGFVPGAHTGDHYKYQITI